MGSLQLRWNRFLACAKPYCLLCHQLLSSTESKTNPPRLCTPSTEPLALKRLCLMRSRITLNFSWRDLMKIVAYFFIFFPFYRWESFWWRGDCQKLCSWWDWFYGFFPQGWVHFFFVGLFVLGRNGHTWRSFQASLWTRGRRFCRSGSKIGFLHPSELPSYMSRSWSYSFSSLG